jgi:hypothetical protein
MKNDLFRLPKVSASVSIIAGIVSIVLLFNASEHPPIILRTLFIGWVLVPYIGMIIITNITKKRDEKSQRLIFYSLISLSLLSMIAFTGIFRPENSKPAFTWLIVPLVSWIIIAIILLISKKIEKNNIR